MSQRHKKKEKVLVGFETAGEFHGQGADPRWKSFWIESGKHGGKKRAGKGEIQPKPGNQPKQFAAEKVHAGVLFDGVGGFLF